MGKLVYKERLSIIISEMDRSSALRMSDVIESIMDSGVTDKAVTNNILAYTFVSYSPYKVVYDGKVLEDGKHILVFDDESTIELTLPITNDCFDALPYSLTRDWQGLAEKENEGISNHFLFALNRIAQKSSEPMSVNGQS